MALGILNHLTPIYPIFYLLKGTTYKSKAHRIPVGDQAAFENPSQPHLVKRLRPLRWSALLPGSLHV